MSDTFTVACAQLHSVRDVATNLGRCLRFVQQAVDRDVDLLVFPEATASRIDSSAETSEAQPLDGPFVSALAAATAGTALTVIVGLIESNGGDRPFNTLVALRDGELIGTYRKIHLYDAAATRESDSIMPGDGPVATFDLHGLTIGMMTCYDVRFPELARALALQGADLIAVPTSWMSGPLKEEQWRVMCAARAMENTVYLVAASQTGGRRIGLSTVVAPTGVPIASLGAEESLLVTTIDRRLLEETRIRFPLLQQRRFSTSAVPGPVAARTE